MSKKNARVFVALDENPTKVPVECSSEEGITIGLIDTIMTAANALMYRDLKFPGVIEALKDLRSNESLRRLIVGDLGLNHNSLLKAYQYNALERTMRPKGFDPDKIGRGKLLDIKKSLNLE